jgi:hypothetical protein
MKRDLINTTSADTLFAEFTERANAEHARRLAKIQCRLVDVMADEQVGRALKAMIAMDGMHRHRLFGNVLWNTEGARSIDGMEAILSFVENYLLDDSFCHAVSYVPTEEIQAIYRKNFVTTAEWTAEEEGVFADWLACEARWFMLVPGEDQDGRRLTACEILEVILHNETLHDEDETRREREMVEFLDDNEPSVPLPGLG